MYIVQVFTYELIMKNILKCNLKSILPVYIREKKSVLKFRYSIMKKGHSQLLNKPCLVKSPTE